MNPDDVLEEQGRHVRRYHGFGCRDEEHLLRQAVNDYLNGVVVVAWRQVRDLVEGHAAPGLGRDRKGGQ